MPRGFRRSFRGGSRPRRTNWIAKVASDPAVVNNGEDVTVDLLDVGTAANEEAKYVDSTLVRVRGVILLDFDVVQANTTGSQPQKAGLWIACSETSVDGWSSDTLSRDSILWADMQGAQFRERVEAGTESNDTVQSFFLLDMRSVVDIKAQRRLGDRMKLQLHIENIALTGGVGLRYWYFFRMLLKE